MPTHYEILGVTEEADFETIKQAYHQHALVDHPDKGGDPEKFKALSTAYSALSDPERRTEYDQKLAAVSGPETMPAPVKIAGYLLSDAKPFSYSYQQLHQRLEQEYQQNRMSREPFKYLLSDFAPSLPSLTEPTLSWYQTIAHGFAYVTGRAIDSFEDYSAVPEPTQPLTPELAMTTLLEFFDNTCPSERLLQVKRQLSDEIRAGRNNALPKLALYQGVYQLILMMQRQQHAELGWPLAKILSYAQADTVNSIDPVARLLAHPRWRALHAETLHQYWQVESSSADVDITEALGGLESTRRHLAKLQQQLSESADERLHPMLIEQINQAKLLYHFENSLTQPETLSLDPNPYQKKAYRILDWFPALSSTMETPVVVNLLLRAGAYFKQSSLASFNPQARKADEHLAFIMFHSAIASARRATPDVELYALTVSLHQLARCRYLSSEHETMLKSYQQRALWLSDIFPIFYGPRNNIVLLNKARESRNFIKDLLTAFVDFTDIARARGEEPTDERTIAVLYLAYEGCLKNWYQDAPDPELEQRLRVALMQAMLAHKKWSKQDIHKNVDAAGYLVERDMDGWMKPSRSLPITAYAGPQAYESIDGFSIDYTQGELNFFFRAPSGNNPASWRLVTPYDLLELIQKNIHHGIFSLDGPNPDMPYHPFNQMRIEPAAIYRTQLMHTMLVTDYLLKFLTTGREVSGKFPYDRRSLDRLISDLPYNLRIIIQRFQDHSVRAESFHRFWIQADDVMVAQHPAAAKTQLALGELNMRVQKHEMERDARGNLVDKPESDEGWPLYVLTRAQIAEVAAGTRKIQDPALVFIQDLLQVTFYEEAVFSPEFTIANYANPLHSFYGKARDAQGRVLQNPASEWLSYQVTREVCRQAGKSHRFSPETAFAKEFTAHYDEFAVYFPEFGRLKAFTRMVLLVNYLNGVRDNLDRQITELAAQIEDAKTWQPFADALDQARKQYEDARQTAQRDISAKLKALVKEVRAGQATKLQGLKTTLKQLQPLKYHIFTVLYQEVEQYCQDKFRVIEAQTIQRYGEAYWHSVRDQTYQQVVKTQRSDNAREYYGRKRTGCFTQLCQTFTERLGRTVNRDEIEGAINTFLDGDVSALHRLLVEHEHHGLTEQILRDSPCLAQADVTGLLNGVIAGATAKMVEFSLSQVKAQFQRITADIQTQKQAAVTQYKTKLEQLKRVKAKLTALGLPDKSPEGDLSDKCLWVPANIRHETTERSSRLVYGGVNICAKTQTVERGHPQYAQILQRTVAGAGQVGVPAGSLLTAKSQLQAATAANHAAGVWHAQRSQAVAANRMAEAHSRGVDVNQMQAHVTATGKPWSGPLPMRPPVTNTATMPAARSAFVPPTASAGGAGGTGGRPPFVPPPSAPPSGGAGGSGGGAGRNGGGGGGRPPYDPPPPPNNADSGGTGRKPGGGAPGNTGGGASGTGAGRPPSPTAFYEASAAAGAARGFDRREVTQGFQKHHIVSHTNDATKAHPLLALAGYDLQERSNIIFLPEQPESHPTRAPHFGRHLPSYSKFMKAKMDFIVRTGEAAGWNQAQYRAELEQMLSEVRQELKAGNIGLNKHMRPWATVPGA